MRAATPLFLVSLLALTALSGCLSDRSDPAAEASDMAFTGKAFSHYIRDHSLPLAGVSLEDAIIEQYRVPAEDGVELDTWIVRPPIDEPVPVVLEVTPYYGGGQPIYQSIEIDELGLNESLSSGVGLLADVLVRHGYAYGISSVRGTGNSEGCFTQGGPQEGRDTAHVVEAMAAESWSNGNVGIIGVSYPGTTPQQAWLEAPPSLKTIVPISGISDFYKYNFKNGVPIWVQGYGFNTYYWPLTSTTPVGLSGGVGLLDPVHLPGKILGEACEAQLEVQSAGVQATLDGDKGEYWQTRDFPAIHRDTWALNPQRASVFYIHGLQDWNVKPHHMEEWLEQIQESGVPYKAWLGQWGHAWPAREDWWNLTVVAWFDEFLKEMDTGILDAPAVQVQDDEGRWRHEERWPPATTTERVLYPHDDGTLKETPGSGEATYHDRFGGKSPPAGTPDTGFDEVDGALNTAQETLWGPDRIVFRSEPFETDTLLAGMPRFIANVTASGERASLMLSLHEVNDHDERRSFNYGVLSLNHAENIEQGDEDIRGKRVRVELDLFPQDSLIKAGNRIELIAAGNLIGSPMPAFEPISTGSQITIDLEGARLILPVVQEAVLEEPQPCWEDEERCDPMNRS